MQLFVVQCHNALPFLRSLMSIVAPWSPPFAGIRLAAFRTEVQECREIAHLLQVSLVAVSDSASVDRTCVHELASGTSASGSEPAAAISGVVPATWMGNRPVYNRHQWTTCSLVSCDYAPSLPFSGVVTIKLKLLISSSRSRGGNCVGPPRLDP